MSVLRLGLRVCFRVLILHDASRTFLSPFGTKHGGTYQQYCLTDAELASKVSFVKIVSAS